MSCWNRCSPAFSLDGSANKAEDKDGGGGLWAAVWLLGDVSCHDLQVPEPRGSYNW